MGVEQHVVTTAGDNDGKKTWWWTYLSPSVAHPHKKASISTAKFWQMINRWTGGGNHCCKNCCWATLKNSHILNANCQSSFFFLAMSNITNDHVDQQFKNYCQATRKVCYTLDNYCFLLLGYLPNYNVIHQTKIAVEGRHNSNTR